MKKQAIVVNAMLKPKKHKSDRSARKAKTAREMLNQIDRFLASDEIERFERRALWNVLTALRGPDSVSYETKLISTIPIRRAALPKTTQSNNSPADFGDKKVDLIFFVPRSYNTHFNNHAKAAAYSLGLDVHEN